MADANKIIRGGLNIAKRVLGDGEEAVTAAQRAEAGRKAAELIKSQPQVKASEALGQLMEKGFKRTTTTQADRTRVGGGNIGGAPFSALSEADPNYAGKVWGVMDEGAASRLKNLTSPDTAWTTMLGSADQLKTNPIVFDKLKRQFIDAMKQGKLSPELEAKINHNLALNFGEGAQIRDPSIWKQADTFEKRAALADLMMGQGIPPKKGGVALGGEKSGKGVIFKPTDTLKRETEPTLLHTEHGGDTPTFAAGPRLFTLENESVYRPDLHPGFPTLLTGKDLEVNMIPTPTEVYLPDWHKDFKNKKPERFQGPWAQDIIERRKNKEYRLKGAEGPGYYDLALGLKGEGLPSQDLNDEYIRHLLREGFKKGGAVDFKAADARLAKAIENRMAKGGSVDFMAADARLADAIAKRMADGGVLHMADAGKVAKDVGKVVKRMFADPEAVTPAISRGTRKFGDDAGGLNIIKETGGNWSPSGEMVYKSNLDRELEKLEKGKFNPLQKNIEIMLENAVKAGDTRQIQVLTENLRSAIGNEAANKWVQSNLRNYITKQMATEADPVRKLAEQGITAFPKNIDEYGDLELRTYGSAKAKQNRKDAGYVPEGVAKSPLAKHYETMTDESINPIPAKEYQRIQALPPMQRPAGTMDAPWVNKLDPETPIFSLNRDADFNKLGFDHIMDVLREDVAAGRIRPEKLNTISIEQAVRRTHEYDETLKANMLNARIAEQANANVFKEYPEGYKWVQLDKPGQFALESDVMGHSVRGYEPPKGHPDYTDISGDSGYDTYGHGGYESIKAGKAKIYSLRDPKGMSHATIEVAEHENPYGANGSGFVDLPSKTRAEYENIIRQWRRNNPEVEYLTDADINKALKEAGVQPINSPEITQIKGKQNAAPNENYLPFVQDFVKSGKFSEVGDFGNTGLVRIYPESDLAKSLAQKGMDVPSYATQKEITDLLKQAEVGSYRDSAGGKTYKPEPPAEGMAQGGSAFKKLQFMDKGGITTSGGTFSAEELGVNPSDLVADEKLSRKIKRGISNEMDIGKEQLEQEYRQLGNKGGKRDAAIRIGSQIAGGGIDSVNFGLTLLDSLQGVIPALSKPESVMDAAGTRDRVPKFKLAFDEPALGGEHLIRKFKEAQLLGDNEFPLTEFLANFVVPTAAANALRKSKQAYQGAKTLMDTPKKRQGGLTAMAR